MIKEMFIYETDDRVVLERNTISDQEAMQLACVGTITMGGTRYYKKCRYDTILAAQNGKQPDDLIVEHRTAVFLLTTHQSHAEPCTRALLHLKADPVKDTLKEIEERRRRPYEFSSRATLGRRITEERSNGNRPEVLETIKEVKSCKLKTENSELL